MPRGKSLIGYGVDECTNRATANRQDESTWYGWDAIRMSYEFDDTRGFTTETGVLNLDEAKPIGMGGYL